MVRVTLVSGTASVAVTDSVVVTDHSAEERKMKWALGFAAAEKDCLSVDQLAVRAAAVREQHGPQSKKFPPTTKPSTSV